MKVLTKKLFLELINNLHIVFKVLMMTLQDPPPRLDAEEKEKYSKHFRDLIHCCLQRDPEKRCAFSLDFIFLFKIIFFLCCIENLTFLVHTLFFSFFQI